MMRTTMTNKLDLLLSYARKFEVDTSLVLEVFEIERGRLHPGEDEQRYRQQEISELIESWVENHSSDVK
jgi:hypothetical protein